MSTIGANDEPGDAQTRATAAGQQHLIARMAPEARPLAAGASVGRYRVSSIIGRGGMGRVYAAVDPVLRREVAIKVTSNPALTRSEQVAREARMLAAVSHPNIVTIHDSGCYLERRYIVMELLRGETLRARVVRQRPGSAEIVAWACDVLAALAAAHDANIVHLDLKPDNLFLTRSGAIKLLDFGISRLIREPMDPDPEAAFAGTAAYMAPEQRDGLTVGPRTDLYAFGVVMHELVTGRRLHGPASARAASSRSVADGWPGPAFEQVVRGCLEVDPDDRPGSAHEVKAALDGALGRPPVAVTRR